MVGGRHLFHKGHVEIHFLCSIYHMAPSLSNEPIGLSTDPNSMLSLACFSALCSVSLIHSRSLLQNQNINCCSAVMRLIGVVPALSLYRLGLFEDRGCASFISVSLRTASCLTRKMWGFLVAILTCDVPSIKMWRLRVLSLNLGEYVWLFGLWSINVTLCVF